MTGSTSDASEIAADAARFRLLPPVQQLAGGKQLDGTTAHPDSTKPAEKLLGDGDILRFETLYRMALGFLTVPVLSHAVGEQRADWALVPFLLSVLLILRVVPILLRRLVPFKDSAQRAWAERRQLGKRYDSYQWQKLLWVGIGLALYMLLSGETTALRVAVSSTCLLSGTLGLAWWRLMAAPRHYGH